MTRALTQDDTICALATSAQSGGVGIIRVSGPSALIVLRQVTLGLPDPPRPRELHFVSFIDGRGYVIDEGYAVWMPAPRSYTAEDVAELQGHGGAANLRRLLSATVAAGARPAQRGEFTLRAFLNGRIDLSQAEAVLDIVQARTETALDLAHAQLRGGLSSEVRALRHELLNVRARLEVQIDFVDEDLGEVHGARPTAELGAARERAAALAATFARGRVLRSGARVVLCGPPNAGKSSLFNALLRSSRAIVTPVPGTTRDFLEETLDLDGVPVTLVDTAGVRATEEPAEVDGVKRALALASDADLVLVLSEATGPVFTLPEGTTGHVLQVRTKADLAPGDVSAATGFGLDALAATIRERVLPEGGRESNRIVVTSARHHGALRAAEGALARAEEASRVGEPPELIAVDVAEALAELGTIVGETTTEDVLDRIFSTFCIGK